MTFSVFRPVLSTACRLDGIQGGVSCRQRVVQIDGADDRPPTTGTLLRTAFGCLTEMPLRAVAGIFGAGQLAAAPRPIARAES